jgi:hypothetical protein
MKNIQILFLLTMLGCKEPNFKIVETEEIVLNVGDEDRAIEKVFNLYANSNKTKLNYEVFDKGRKFALNWSPKGSILFWADDLCGWSALYKNVDSTKIANLILENKRLSNIGLVSNEFEKRFLLVKDEKEYSDLRNKYFNTNTCRGGKRKTW